MVCDKFCAGPLNTKDGLRAHILVYDEKDENVIGKVLDRCPLGCTTNPGSRKAANNIVANDGWATICLNNYYKYRETEK